MPRRPSKGWAKAAPKTKSQRQRVLAKCGRKAFLKPDTLAYPIVGARSRSCQPDCRGLVAAERRARQFGHNAIAAKARRLAKRARCAWTR